MKRILVIVLFIIAIALTYVSLSPNNTSLLLLCVPLVLVFFGMLMAFFLIAWNSGENFKERFKNGLNLGLMLSASFYILGYVFVIVESLIR